jgi:hypothetical protein
MRGIRFALAARTAAALVVALALTFATDRDAQAAPDRAADRILLAAASWHGRPIQAPHRHDTVHTSAGDRPLDGWSAGPVGYGAGDHRPGGSDRVREVQRRLARLGYRVGPVDGRFGRVTRASVAWFQVKHGLPVTGRATLAMVRHLRSRTGRSASAPDRSPGAARSTAAREPAWEAFRQLVGPRVPVPDGRSTQTTTWPVAMWVLIALVALDVVLLLGLYRQRRSGTVTRITLGPPEPLPAEPPAPLPARRFAPPVAVPPERPPDDVPAGARERGHE